MSTAVQVCAPTFESCLDEFVAKINAAFKAEANRDPNSKLAWTETEDGSDVPEDKVPYFRPVAIERNRKYIRIVQRNGSGGSVYCFVEKVTGRILKAASFKTPAKGGRGSIFALDRIPTAYLSSTGWLYAN